MLHAQGEPSPVSPLHPLPANPLASSKAPAVSCTLPALLLWGQKVLIMIGVQGTPKFTGLERAHFSSAGDRGGLFMEFLILEASAQCSVFSGWFASTFHPIQLSSLFPLIPKKVSCLETPYFGTSESIFGLPAPHSLAASCAARACPQAGPPGLPVSRW